MSAAIRPHDRIFARALVLSLLLHVSAVTIFRIVFEFPRKDIEYFHVAIVETPLLIAAVSPADASKEHLSVAGPDFANAAAAPASLPTIELPALRFEAMDRLRMRQEALETRTRYDELFSGGHDDTTGPGDRALGALSQTLSRLTFGTPDDRSDTPTPVSHPAPGFEAYIEWISEPKDRKVLTVQPIEGLWGLSPQALPGPITLVFRVNRDGIVVEMFNPLSETSELVRSTVQALGKYRFEPLLGDGPPTQGGTFIVRAEGDKP